MSIKNSYKVLRCSFFFSSRRRHTRSLCDWSSDVCSSDLITVALFPVLRKLPRTTRKNSARQAPDANPGKNQKARIIDNELEVAAALLVVPPNPAVSRQHLPSRRRP